MRVFILGLTSLCATATWADTPFYAGAGWGWTQISQSGRILEDTAPFNFDHDIDGTGDGFCRRVHR